MCLLSKQRIAAKSKCRCLIYRLSVINKRGQNPLLILTKTQSILLLYKAFQLVISLLRCVSHNGVANAKETKVFHTR